MVEQLAVGRMVHGLGAHQAAAQFGPVRVEYAWVLSPRPGESKKVSEFTIGTAF